MTRVEVIVHRKNGLGFDLAFKFGDRFQAISFDGLQTNKQTIVDRLHKLAENIANDESIE